MFKIKSYFLKLVIISVIILGSLLGSANAQSCLNCPIPMSFTYKVQNPNTYLSSLGVYGGTVSNSCFLFTPGSSLVIDVPVTFSGCGFWLASNSVIDVLSWAEFSGATNMIGTCGPNANGIHVYSGAVLNAYSILMDIGAYGLGYGISADAGSFVYVNNGSLKIDNCSTAGISLGSGAHLIANGSSTSIFISNTPTGIDCMSCDVLSINGLTVNSTVQTGISATGSPSIAIANANITTKKEALTCQYSATSYPPVLQISGSTFSSGDGTPFTALVGTIDLTGPITFYANAFIRKNTIIQKGNKRGLTMTNLEGV